MPSVVSGVLGSRSRRLPGIGVLGLPGSWSCTGVGNASKALKSPVSSAAVGTVLDCGVAVRRILFHSSPAKKNSLPRLMGPPKSHPKSLKRRGVFSAPGAGFFASSFSLRMNSKTVQWEESPPLRVTTLIEAPEFRPYADEKFDDL